MAQPSPLAGYDVGRIYPTTTGVGTVADALQQMLYERALEQDRKSVV